MSRFVFKSFLNTISEYKQSTSNPMKYDCFESFWEYEWKIDLLSTRCKLLPVHIIFHNVQHPLSECLLYFGGSFDVVVAFVISMPCKYMKHTLWLGMQTTFTLLACNDKSEIENYFSASHHFKKIFIAANRNDVQLCLENIFLEFKWFSNNKNITGVIIKHKNAALIQPVE